MALTERHRSSIYLSLIPLLGEEEAEALLAQFPAHDLDTPATKEFVRAEIAELRAEMHEGFRRQTVWFIGTLIALGSVMTAVLTGAIAILA